MRKGIKIILIIISILIAYVCFNMIYRFIACYGWPVMTREQKEIFYNSTLDLTQENLERRGFELLNYESSKLKHAKFFEEEGVDGWCEIIFSTQEEMKQYVCKNLSDVRMSQFIVPTYTLAGKREKICQAYSNNRRWVAF